MAATISVKRAVMFEYDDERKSWFARSRTVSGKKYYMDVRVVRGELIIGCPCPTKRGKVCWHEREFRAEHEARLTQSVSPTFDAAAFDERYGQSMRRPTTNKGVA